VFLSNFDGPDQVFDFTSGTDTLEINRTGFGIESSATLQLSSGTHVWEVVRFDGSSQGRLSFDPTSGWLRWDPTPNDADETIHLATLAGGALTIDDFLLA
jgi:hypothetical protein